MSTVLETREIIERLGHVEQAVNVYNHVCLYFPEYQFDGVYFDGEKFYILVLNLSGEAYTNLSEKFNDSIRPVIMRIEVVNELPNGVMERLKPLSVEEEGNLQGSHMTTSDFYLILDKELPFDFPRYSFDFVRSDFSFHFYTEDELTISQKDLINRSISKFGPRYNIVFETKKMDKEKNLSSKENGINLTSSNKMGNLFSLDVLKSLQRDQDLWSEFNSNKTKVYSEYKGPLQESSCIIDPTLMTIGNIRPFLTLFEKLYLSPPPLGKQEEYLKLLSITMQDLKKLVSSNKVVFIAPSNPVHADHGFINEMIGNEANFIFSRELAIKSILETNRRVPFLNSALSMEQKIVLVKLLKQLARDLSDDVNKSYYTDGNLIDFESKRLILNFLNNLANSLANIYRDELFVYGTRGAMGSYTHGFGRLISDLIKEKTNSDPLIEVGLASSIVEWSGALGASCLTSSIPYVTPMFAESIVSTYSGTKRLVPIFESEMSVAADKILCLSGDEPMDLFIDTLSSDEISRFRGVCNSLAKSAKSKEELDYELQRFNSVVERVSTNKTRLEKWQVSSLAHAGGAISAAAVDPSGAALNIGVWVLKVVDGLAKENPKYNYAKDVLDALGNQTSVSSVLAYRIRNKLGK